MKPFDGREFLRSEEQKKMRKRNLQLQQRIASTEPYYHVEDWEAARKKTEHTLKVLLSFLSADNLFSSIFLQYMGMYPYTPPKAKKKSSETENRANAQFLNQYWERTMAAFSESHPEILARAERVTCAHFSSLNASITGTTAIRGNAATTVISC